jgi:5-methylcytosine-specific restriction endonuclease McrA
MSSRVRLLRLREARLRGQHTSLEWQVMVHLFKRCVRCGANANLEKDHIVPIYQNGSDAIENIQPVCARCNASKGPEDIDHRERALSGWHNEFTRRMSVVLA